LTHSHNGRIIIVGGTGVIGSATASAALANNCDLITTSRNPCSRNQLAFELLNDDIINIIPNLSKEDCLVLLAGYSKMSWIYNNPQLARALNVDATIRLVDQCRSRETPVFFMSTDQVFDGTKGGYDEKQNPNPLNLYGQMKVEVEKHLLESNNKNCIMRTGWNVPQDIKFNCVVKDAYQKLFNDGARMAFDNFINITDVRDTARAIINLTQLKHRPRIIHLTACPPLNRKVLCDQIILSSKYKERMSFEEIRFSELSYTEPRPLKAWMSNKCAIEDLGFKFSSPEATIQMKVALLDDHKTH
jgi:dTDP-4-dehydrorhamnose reductase